MAEDTSDSEVASVIQEFRTCSVELPPFFVSWRDTEVVHTSREAELTVFYVVLETVRCYLPSGIQVNPPYFPSFSQSFFPFRLYHTLLCIVR